MGYGAFSIVHDVFHAIPNMVHYHNTHDHHHVEDHHNTLQQLKQTDNNDSPIHSPLKIIYLLSFLMTDNYVESKAFGLQQVVSSSHHNFIKIYQYAPPTPPPIRKS